VGGPTAATGGLVMELLAALLMGFGMGLIVAGVVEL
jgi:hypothetical protein